MYKLKGMFQETGSSAEFVSQYNRHMADLIARLDSKKIAEVIDVIRSAGESGRTIYTIANGGSAAVASHFVNDLGVNSLVAGRRGFRVISLVDNVESVTAVANDVGYESIFKLQLQCGMEPGDVLVAMSVSGNSENIVRAVEWANEAGAHTIGFCGFDGGKLRDMARTAIHIPTTPDEYGPVEDVFSVLCHTIAGYLSMERGRFLHH